MTFTEPAPEGDLCWEGRCASHPDEPWMNFGDLTGRRRVRPDLAGSFKDVAPALTVSYAEPAPELLRRARTPATRRT